MSETPSSTSSPDGQEQVSHHSQYRLRVTAGPAHDPATHKLVAVNAAETMTIESEHMILSLAVRIRQFTGFPESSPATSQYFDHEHHKADQYSIAFSFIPKTDISGADLVFGNDFDRPIRDRLPPGFDYAFKIVKWWIDPGLEGDVYADLPYLYGPALSSWNVFWMGDKVVEPSQRQESDIAWTIPNSATFSETVVQEGAEGSGQEVRTALGIPSDATSRKKYYLTPSNRDAFTFEAGRMYQSDFANPYLDFNDFSLKLPGFSLNVIKYVDAKTHELRYTLKNKSTGDVYAVVMFTLLFGHELEQITEPSNAGHDEQNHPGDADDVPSDQDDVD